MLIFPYVIASYRDRLKVESLLQYVITYHIERKPRLF